MAVIQDPYTADLLAPSGDTTGAADYLSLNAILSKPNGVANLGPYTYYVNKPIIMADNASIIGDGPGTSTIQAGSGFSTSNAAVIQTQVLATSCTFRDFCIQVQQLGGGSSHGLWLVSQSGQPVTLHRVDNVFVYYAGGDGIHVGAAVLETNVSNCFTYCCHHGYYTEVSATDNKFFACSAAQSSSDGFYIMGNTTHYLGCKSYYSGAISGTNLALTTNWNDASGFHLAPAATQTLSRVWMDSCEAQNNATNGLFADGSASTAVVDKCTFVDCASDGDNVRNDLGAGFKVYNATNNTFTNLDVNIGSGPTNPSTTIASGSNGGEISTIASWAFPSAGVISLVSTTGFSTTGGTFTAATTTTVATCTFTGVSGNTLTGCAYVSGSATGDVISGYAVTQTSPTCQINFGLALFSTLTNTSFVNCHFSGNNGATYIDGSVTGTYAQSRCSGVNPVGKLASPPNVGLTTAAVTNTTGVDCNVYVTVSASGGATSISVGGNATGITSSTASAVLGPVRVPVGQTIALTYTNAPTWVWFGD
jgi:hypothetical protein